MGQEMSNCADGCCSNEIVSERKAKKIFMNSKQSQPEFDPIKCESEPSTNIGNTLENEQSHSLLHRYHIDPKTRKLLSHISAPIENDKKCLRIPQISQYILPPNSKHATSSSIIFNDIEIIRSDIRDIIWENAELLQSDPNHRQKVWRYMSKVFYGKSAESNYDCYKKLQLPTNEIQKRNNENKSENTTMTKTKLKLLLDREETYRDFLINSNPNQIILMNKVRPKMERILEAYACANQNRFALSGAVQLCAVILTTFNTPSAVTSGTNSDCQDTFFILQILSKLMAEYYSNDCKLMRDETLILVDILCVNEQQLVSKLNSLGIDVIDLSTFIVSWIGSLFVHHFEIEFVQRVIDLVLLEGPSVLIAIVYGILQFLKKDILQCENHYDVFEKLAGDKLKSYLRKHEFIHRIINKARLLFTQENYKHLIKDREKKSWSDLLGLPGQTHFRIVKGVGDKAKVKQAYQHWREELCENVNNAAYWDAETEQFNGDEIAIDKIRRHTSSNSYIETNQSRDETNTLQAANDRIEQLQATIQKQQTEIETLKSRHQNRHEQLRTCNCYSIC